METTDIVSLYEVLISRESDMHCIIFFCHSESIINCWQNSSEELYSLFEQFYDHFHANPQDSSHGKFISSHSNDVHALDQLRTIKNKASSSSQVNIDRTRSMILFFEDHFSSLFHKMWNCRFNLPLESRHIYLIVLNWCLWVFIFFIVFYYSFC